MEIELWLIVVQNGLTYGLVALAYHLWRQSTGVINFAVGAYVAFAALVASALGNVPAAAMVIAAIGAATLFSIVTEVAVVRPIERRTIAEFVPVVAVVAVLFVVGQLAGVLFGRQPLNPARLIAGNVSLLGVMVGWQYLVSVLVGLVIFVLVAVWLSRGRYGRMTRAVGDNPTAARTLGLPVGSVRLSAVAVGGAVCGATGLVFVSQSAVTFESGVFYTLAGAIALVLGGSGRIAGPLVGGLLIALIETASARYLGGDYRDYVLLMLVLVVFLLRPDGIFSVKVRST